MKFLIFLIAFLSVTSINSLDFVTKNLPFGARNIEDFLPKNVTISPAIQFGVISQRLDHFNPQNLQTFSSLYLINDEFFQPNGPIIIFLYLEPSFFIDAGYIYISGGAVHDLARNLNGSLVAPSHRFYPGAEATEDLSIENLRFLTIAQALEDMAHLITHLKSDERYRNSGKIANYVFLSPNVAKLNFLVAKLNL